MKILITGSTGFVGSHLVPFLESQGHEIFHLVSRNADTKNKIHWNIDSGSIETEKITEVDAVINLVGENIASGKWTKDKKQKIYDSRINGTNLLVSALKNLNIIPKVWINASAVGYYGNTGDKINFEDSPNGSGFLAKVCKDWETAAFSIASDDTRVVILRFGVILNKSGGLLSQIIPIFKTGFSGNLGNGKQYFSWVALDDVINIINFALNSNISGVFNTTSPDAVTNAEFTKAFSKALNKLAILPSPSILLKLVYGEMADALLLSSTRTTSEKLQNAGYEFKHPNLKEFLMKEFQTSTN